MPDRRDLDDLKLRAEGRVLDVCARLGLDTRKRVGPKGRVLAESPLVRQETPSFNIYTRGSGIGFYDFATGDGGDIFALVAAYKGWWHLKDRGFLKAKRYLEDLLGVRALDPAQRKRDLDNARRQRARDDRRAAEEAARAIGRAKQAFFNATLLHGAPLLQTYLQSRGIDLDALPLGPRGGKRWPGSLRFSAAEPHVWEGRRDDPRNGERSEWPCMIACCVDPASGEVRAIHRTWLARNGRGKAPVTPVRKSWPSVEGLVIPIWRGESALSVPQALANGLLENVLLAEGIETTLSGVLADPRPRAWAVISLGNLQALRLPANIDGVLLSRENDWIKPQAVAQFEAGKRALERQGRAIAEVRAFGGNDLNDVLKESAA